MFGIFLFLIYYMQVSLGYSAVRSGLAMLPMVAVIGVIATVGNIKLMPRFGPKPPVTVGLLLNAAGMAALTRIGVHSGYASALLGPLMVTGVGMGFVFGAAANTGTFGVAPRDAGVASASVNTGQQLGGSIGTALLNTIAASATTAYLASHLHGRPTSQLIHLAAIHGYTTVFWCCAGVFAAGAVICGALLRRGPLTRPRSGLGGAAGQAVDEDVDEELEALAAVGEGELVGQGGHVREGVGGERGDVVAGHVRELLEAFRVAGQSAIGGVGAVVDAGLVDGEAVDGGDQQQVSLDGQVRGEAAGAEDGQDAFGVAQGVGAHGDAADGDADEPGVAEAGGALVSRDLLELVLPVGGIGVGDLALADDLVQDQVEQAVLAADVPVQGRCAGA
jgi:hypothetical protein